MTISPSPPTPQPDDVSEDKTLMVWNNCSISSLRYVTFVLGYCTGISAGGQTYQVMSFSNGTVSPMTYDPTLHQMSLTVDGPSGETGYINMSIPKELLDFEASEWRITVDGRLIDYSE